MTLASAEELLDDPDALEAVDAGGMLAHVMAAPAQLREAAHLAGEVALDSLLEDGRPRAVVVAGMGGSGIAGDVLAAVAGPGCPVPIVVHRGYGLPGWVGPADLVAAVSCSGTTEETLSATDEALRRGCRVLTVGAVGSPLADRVRAGMPHFPVPGGRPPRASVWALSVPLLVAADGLGIAHCPPAVLADAVDLLETLTERYKATKDSFLNPAKSLALALVAQLPVVWGSSPLAGVAAYRLACQLAENAKTPALWGVLPEANHNTVVAFDDPVEDRPVALVLLRDSDEQPQVAKRAEVSAALARDRGRHVTEVVAEGDSPLARLASLVAYGDFVSTYLAFALGVDPTPVAAIDALKSRIRD